MKSEDSGDMSQRAVDLCFIIVPIMTVGVGTVANALSSAARVRLAEVFEQFIAVYAKKFVARIGLSRFESLANGSSQRASLHLPELIDANSGRVEFQSGAHRREKCGIGASCKKAWIYK